MVKSNRLLIGIPLAFTVLVGWFAWTAFRSAPSIAAENLRGAGLSIAAAIEQLAEAGPGFSSLARYTTRDIAYFKLVDRAGTIRYHTNPRLIGTTTGTAVQLPAAGYTERRELLGTGEEVYLLRTAIHAGAGEYLLELALHTFRADEVIRRARVGVSVITALTAALWGLTLLALFMLRRDERRQRELRRREELAHLGEMGAVLAHEIRNPLAGIKGFAQLIEAAKSLEAAQRHAGRIVAQSVRLEALVNDLLAYARDDAAKKEAVDLPGLVRECLAMARPEATGHQVRIEADLPERLRLTGSSGRLTQLLLNLFRNAIQAMPDGGDLTVRLARQGRTAVLAVSDTGSGIPPEHINDIFTPFWTSKTTGTGLGLALCRKVADEHGGSITVASTVGVGTVVTVTLPMNG